MIRSVFSSSTRALAAKAARRGYSVPMATTVHKEGLWLQTQQRRGFFSTRSITLGDNTWRTPVVIIAAALGLSTIGFFSYSMVFGPGSKYPKDVRKLLREGGMAYLRTPDRQDLPKAVEAYTMALERLDELGKTDPTHSQDAAHVTGLVARIATVYSDMGDLENTIKTYKNLLQRILGHDGLDDPTKAVRVLLDDSQPADARHNIIRALGCANKLAETYEAREKRSKRRSILIADPNLTSDSSSDTREASRWYQWCLQVVMLTYQNHFNHEMLKQDKPLQTTPSFDPESLPKCFSVDIVTSLFYNAAAFFASHAQYDFAVPLLQRGLDLMRRGADGKETNVCRSSVLMSHLANAAVEQKKLPEAEKWAIEGLNLAKKYSQNAECLNSFIALTYDLGIVYERSGNLDDARMQFRQAIEVSKAIGDDDAVKLSQSALNRTA